MGLKLRFFGHKQEDKAETPPPAAKALCPHTAMTPRWDRAEDMGHLDRATGFHCEGCGGSFTPQEAQSLRDHAGERLRETIS